MKRQVAFAVLSLITSTAAVRGATWPYENWPMYGKDLSHTFSNPITQINRGNVGSLMPAWTFPTGDAVSASPAVVDVLSTSAPGTGFSMPSMPQLASFGGRCNWTANRRSFLFPRFAGGLRLERRPRAAFRPPVESSRRQQRLSMTISTLAAAERSIALQRTMGT